MKNLYISFCIVLCIFLSGALGEEEKPEEVVSEDPNERALLIEKKQSNSFSQLNTGTIPSIPVNLACQACAGFHNYVPLPSYSQTYLPQVSQYVQAQPSYQQIQSPIPSQLYLSQLSSQYSPAQLSGQYSQFQPSFQHFYLPHMSSQYYNPASFSQFYLPQSSSLYLPQIDGQYSPAQISAQHHQSHFTSQYYQPDVYPQYYQQISQSTYPSFASIFGGRFPQVINSKGPYVGSFPGCTKGICFSFGRRSLEANEE